MTSLFRISLSVAAIALSVAPAAGAQAISPSGGVSALDIGQSGVSLEVDPQQGVTLGADPGGTGGITVGAGPQGAQVNLPQGSQVNLPQGAASPSAATDTPAKQTPAARTPDTPSTGDAPATRPAGPSGETDRGGAGGSSDSGTRGATGSAPADAAAAGTGRRLDAKTAADKSARDSAPGVAPVIDLIEKIPAAVWAALLSLGLIALALWMMWVRGRRRLERNAWVDADSPEMNVVAFEALLAQEWARSDRYRRPLGLLLLELEEPTSDGGRRPLTGRYRGVAQDAITTQAREADIVAQLSPSRFAVICPEASQGSVETMARKLEHSLEAARIHARVGTAVRLETDRGPADLVSRAAVGIDDQPTWETPVITPPAAKPESQPDSQPVAA